MITILRRLIAWLRGPPVECCEHGTPGDEFCHACNGDDY